MPAMKRVRFSNINAMYSPVPLSPSSPLFGASFTFTPSATNSLPNSDSSSRSQSSSGSKKSRYHHHHHHNHDGTSTSTSKPKSLTTTTTTRSRMLPRPQTIHIPPQPIRIHFLLAFQPFKQPPIPYDLSISPSILEPYFPSNILSESATDPPVASLTITCPYLKWDIPITPYTHTTATGNLSGRKAHAYVSVSDVLHALYRALRLTVHPVEYEALQTQGSPDAVRNVNGAYFKRCGAIVDERARKEEEGKGVKRVDFLMGRNRFLGLSKGSTKTTTMMTRGPPGGGGGGFMKHDLNSGEMIWELNVSE